MNRVRFAIASFGVMLASPVIAQDFSAGSEAKSWNLYAEQPARFEATVVDPLCLLTGDCPENCGDGQRQLALLRAVDQMLIYAVKNNQPIFTGAANELAPFCGKSVEVDGLMLVDSDVGLNNLYQVQKLREAGSNTWITANRWLSDWKSENVDLDGSGAWYLRDPRIRAEIAQDGYFGLGLEKDAAIIKDLFE